MIAGRIYSEDGYSKGDEFDEFWKNIQKWEDGWEIYSQTRIPKTHTLKGQASTGQVWLDGELLDPKESQRHRNHSPDGFNWGYGGSGPAQLALAVVLAVTGSPIGYQEFKWQYIAGLPMDSDFEIQFTL
jgi:hypothetical protein